MATTTTKKPKGGPGRQFSPSGDERRSEPRVTGARPVALRLVDVHSDGDDAIIQALVTDLSRSGVGVRLCRPIGRGREFLIVFQGEGPGAGTALVYRAVRYFQADPGLFHVGAQFVRRATSEDDPPQGQSPADPATN
jgi:hypothetical protein